MIGQIDFLTKKEGRTRSELLREALRRYAEEQEWKDLIRYGQQQAKKKKIIKDKVEDLIDAIRR